jgi:hypothetical protein
VIGLLFCPEDGDSTFIRNVGRHLPGYTALHSETYPFILPPLRNTQYPNTLTSICDLAFRLGENSCFGIPGYDTV